MSSSGWLRRPNEKNPRPRSSLIKFARYYTPVVIFMAASVAVVPSLVFGQPFDEWLYKALVLLVISCPCALAISTPVSMISGITGAAKNGVLIKGGKYWR
jgi:Cd2+/Zn2+-exporting ATPase